MNPSIGRIVWVNIPEWSDQLCAGIVTYVHNPEQVNLCCFDRNGDTRPLSLVPFYHGNDGLIPPRHCGWMPYQVKTEAARTEQPKLDGIFKPLTVHVERLDREVSELQIQLRKLTEARTSDSKPAVPPTAPQAGVSPPTAKS